MRIIGGEKRSRLLIAPEGLDTRPTGDKAREALFSILAPRIRDACFLDLYAGSGAVALEALSRGAAAAVLCDRDRKAAQAIRKNIAALQYEDKARFLMMSDEAAAAVLAAEKQRFDIVFLDPPYKMDPTAISALMLEKGLIDQESLLVIEHRFETPPVMTEAFELTDRRRYGICGISFYRIVTNDRLV